MSKRCEKYFGVFLPALIAFVPAAQAATCAVAPTCEQLGYVQSSSDCAGAKNILKCPFDLSKLYCSKASAEVKVGSILYGDGSVSDGYEAGKTPIGVVFDAENRLAIALRDVSSKTYVWSSSTCNTSIPDCTDGWHPHLLFLILLLLRLVIGCRISHCGVLTQEHLVVVLCCNGGQSTTGHFGWHLPQ